MFSIKCNNCRQLITLKPEEIEAAIAEAEATKHNFYQMPCPKCRRTVKIQLKMLKLKMPREVPESLDGKAAGEALAKAEEEGQKSEHD